MRDAHVVLPMLKHRLTSSTLSVIPQRVIQQGYSTQVHFAFDANGELQFYVLWNSTSGSETNSQISTIAGKTAGQFIMDLANSPTINAPFQSVGARINFLMSINPVTLVGVSEPLKYTYLPNLFSLQIEGRPSNVLPESFQVTYTDGTSETYYTIAQSPWVDGLVSSDGTTVTLDRTTAEELLDQPGDSFVNFQLMLGQINGTSTVSANRSLHEIGATSLPTFNRRRLAATPFQFDNVMNFTNIVQGGPALAAYKMESDYAILKLESFAMSPLDVLAVWGNLTVAAKAQGVNKLLIDISNNLGGIAETAYALVVAMFPNIDFKWFENQFDLNYNKPMHVFYQEVYPVLQTISSNTATMSNTALQSWIDNTNQSQLNGLQATADAMLQFCVSNCKDLLSACQGCTILDQLYQAASGFVASPSPTSLSGLIQSVASVASSIEPWTVTTAGNTILLYGNASTVRPVIRGGVLTNLTQQVTLYDEQQFMEAAHIASQLGHTFDEYVITSNGASGSSTSIFQTFVTQLWKNKNESLFQNSVVTCTYGGTGNISDTTMTGFPAAVQNIQIENPFIAVGALYMLESLLPANNSMDIRNVRQSYESTLSTPPYFASSFPQMPVLNYYDNFMEPGALPLQYVKMPPDQHIQQLFTAVTLADSFDLDALYTDASQFFVSVPTQSPAVAPSPTPGASPSMSAGGSPSSSGGGSPSSPPPSSSSGGGSTAASPTQAAKTSNASTMFACCSTLALLFLCASLI